MRAVIVDDEVLARRRIRKLLEGDVDVHVVGEARNGREAVSVIRTLTPDLVFLDIQIPVWDGFKVIDLIGRANLPMIIFVTAYDHYAVRAFKVHALDYLLKPFDDDEFRESVARAKETIRHKRTMGFAQRVSDLLHETANDHGGSTRNSARLNRFVIKEQGRILFVPVSDVDWIEASGKYVTVHAGSRACLVRESMSRLMERLDPSAFMRIHRSTIVNLSRVKELQPWAKGEFRVILTNGTRLTSSRSARDLLEKISLE